MNDKQNGIWQTWPVRYEILENIHVVVSNQAFHCAHDNAATAKTVLLKFLQQVVWALGALREVRMVETCFSTCFSTC